MRATQASIGRAIAAARKQGLHVVAIRPDGTVLVSTDASANRDCLTIPIDPKYDDWTDFRA